MYIRPQIHLKIVEKATLSVSIALLSLLLLGSCNSGLSLNTNGISMDSATIAKGKASFYQSCSGCHGFRQDAIGPALGGITDSASADWLQHFIKDPKKMIESGDLRARKFTKEYKVVMPSFASFTDDKINGIIAFLNTRKKYARPVVRIDANAVVNPIPEPIKFSGLVAGIQLVTQFPGSGDSEEKSWARITRMDIEPHSGSSYVLDLQGELYKMQNNKPTLYMNMAGLRPKFIMGPGLATGFCSFAFHPGFAKNGLLYTVHTEAAGPRKADFSYADSIEVAMQCVLTEWKAKNPGADTFSGNGRELLRVDIVTESHAVQDIAFNPHSKTSDKDYGMLYMSTGDGGSVQVGYPFILHANEKVWGSIIRIDPMGSNSANRQYGIPADNPFAQSQNHKALGEIYAYGFRNPHRITWSKSGEMLAFNIGQANIESIYIVLPGHNYGWPAREGNFAFDPYGDLDKVYPLPANDSIYKITYPVAEYDHDEGMAISGGYEYWGTTIQQLKGKLLFGDIPTGRLFYLDIADLKKGKPATIKEWKISINGTQRTLKELCGTDRVDLHFGRDSRGELYILTKSDGKLYKLVSVNLEPGFSK